LRRTTRPPSGTGSRLVRGLGAAPTVVALLALADLALGAVAPAAPHSVTNVDSVSLAASAGWALRLGLASAAALCFVLGPGFALRRFVGPGSLLNNLAFIWVPGALYLAAVGTIAWLLEFAVEPQVAATVLLVPVPLLLIWSTRLSVDGTVRRDEWPVLLLVILLLAIGLGRATWSQGPVGELYAGTASRTLDATNRPDSRIQYNVVLLVENGLAPYGQISKGLFAPYNFYARGPIPGLGAAPVVLAGGATPQIRLPGHKVTASAIEAALARETWEPFDAQGFATYRILLMLLGATCVLGAYGLVRRFLRPRAALAGAVLVAMSPFIVHEVYFTWTKLYAASFAIVALVALLERRPFVAGLLLGLAYLAHPSALIAAPALLLVWASLLWRGAPGLYPEGTASAIPRWSAKWARDSAWMVLGLLIIYGSWKIANSGHTTDFFSSYLFSADGRRPVAFGTWVGTRVHSLANTLVPFRLYVADGDSVWINAFGARSPGVIRFSSLYTATLPFAVGILYFPVFLYGLARFARRAAGLFVAAVVAPFVGFLIYWGANTTGLIREGLQFPFVVALLAAFVGHSVVRPHHRWDRVVRIAATARAVEVVFMVMIPTIATMSLLGGRLFVATDVLAIFLMIGGVLGLAWLTWWAFGPDTDMAACVLGPGQRDPDALAANGRPSR
jgi:hypothetical protein